MNVIVIFLSSEADDKTFGHYHILPNHYFLTGNYHFIWFSSWNTV